jgi:hypothetical protein
MPWRDAFHQSEQQFLRVTEECGGSLLSFYSLFPDPAFSDAAGHFSTSADEDHRAELVDALAAGVRAALAARFGS